MDVLMGLALGLAIPIPTAISAVTGVAEGVSHQRKMNEEMASETRTLKFHIDVTADSASTSRSRVSALNDGIVVARDGRLWIEPKNEVTRQPRRADSHPFTGFYLNYPDEDRGITRGMVTTISKDPPVLHWAFIHKDTYAVCTANRSGSIAHFVGDFDWTEEFGDDSSVSFDGFEGFVAVEEGDGRWGVYFDKDDDGLKSKKGKRRTADVRLMRRVISAQETNKWGLGSEGNLGVKKTEHSVNGQDKMGGEGGG